MSADHRDLALAELAADEAAAVSYAADLLAENRMLRLALSVALERLHVAGHSIDGLARALRALERDGWQRRAA